MKVVFLDVDGVLNDALTFMALLNDTPTKKHLNYLKEIIDATDAKIVVSSTWRTSDKSMRLLESSLETVGLKVYDITEELVTGRGAEIKKWLIQHPDANQFVILDDDIGDILSYYPDNIVKTTMFRGLLKEHVQKAIKILNAE